MEIFWHQHCASHGQRCFGKLENDCRRGQSLVVHAISEGRQAARKIDADLMKNSSLAGPGGVIPYVTQLSLAA
ncbi:hypothetical protein JTE90_015947 [Oedothorax gibbosus]|uniref:Uncharacterized protein n=1 Tax=Oedothorax gibbosus TaxID=931172 RepID=A0AAV6TSQ8_9ARAC|nr:hypothetical protein JTE90_015947 [Oedothorax gibbosus]